MTTPRPAFAWHRRGAAEFFGERAASYDDSYDRGDADTYALRSRLDAVIRIVGAGTGDALDAGMGPGRLCAGLANLGWTVSGIDASPAMVEVARRRLPEARDRLLAAPIERLPFVNEHFDVVTATGVLEYSNVPQALAELARVLRPGGLAVVSYPNPHAFFGIWKTRVWYRAVRGAKRVLRRPDPQMPRGAGSISPPLFARALGAAGLDVEERVPTSYLPVLTPLELVAPRLTVGLARRLERRNAWAHRLATQVVYAARRADAPAGREAT